MKNWVRFSRNDRPDYTRQLVPEADKTSLTELYGGSASLSAWWASMTGDHIEEKRITVIAGDAPPSLSDGIRVGGDWLRRHGAVGGGGRAADLPTNRNSATELDRSVSLNSFLDQVAMVEGQISDSPMRCTGRIKAIHCLQTDGRYLVEVRPLGGF